MIRVLLKLIFLMILFTSCSRIVLRTDLYTGEVPEFSKKVITNEVVEIGSTYLRVTDLAKKKHGLIKSANKYNIYIQDTIINDVSDVDLSEQLNSFTTEISKLIKKAQVQKRALDRAFEIYINDYPDNQIDNQANVVDDLRNLNNTLINIISAGDPKSDVFIDDLFDVLINNLEYINKENIKRLIRNRILTNPINRKKIDNLDRQIQIKEDSLQILRQDSSIAKIEMKNTELKELRSKLISLTDSLNNEVNSETDRLIPAVRARLESFVTSLVAFKENEKKELQTFQKELTDKGRLDSSFMDDLASTVRKASFSISNEADLSQLVHIKDLLQSQAYRLEDLANPRWKTIATSNEWEKNFTVTKFNAKGNSSVVLVQDDPVTYRIQQGSNNPAALIQGQLKIARALADASIQIVGARTGFALKGDEEAIDDDEGDDEAPGFSLIESQINKSKERKSEFYAKLAGLQREWEGEKGTPNEAVVKKQILILLKTYKPKYD